MKVSLGFPSFIKLPSEVGPKLNKVALCEGYHELMRTLYHEKLSNELLRQVSNSWLTTVIKPLQTTGHPTIPGVLQ